MSIVKLSEVRKGDLNIAGGKGTNLGELIHQGFPVPPGFVVTTSAYSEFIEELPLPTGEQGQNAAGSSGADIRAKIVAKKFPPELEDQIQLHHQQQTQNDSREVVYAVRSSATAEDLGDASFAGQHDTYYYVDGPNLPLMVKKCWASLWSESAISYRQSQGIAHSEVKMAVVIQEMIRSDVSGVTFTADPVSGSADLIITEASWGMGAAIVDGRVSPDRFVVDKTTNKLISKKIANKKFMVPAFIDKDGGSRLQEIPTHLRQVECLTPAQVATITDWAMRSEEYYGTHQDLEWCFEGDDFFMLQSRPVTTLGQPSEVVPKGKYVLFKPMVENFTDPFLPLSQDLLIEIFPVLKIIYGRAYMNLTQMRALIPLKISDEDLATIAYMSDIKDFKPRLSVLRLIGTSFILILAYLIFGVLYQRTDNMPDDFMEKFREFFRRTVDDPDITPPGTLPKLFLKTRFFEPVGNMPLMVNITAPRYMLLLALLKALLHRWLPELGEDAASLMSSGNDGVLSTEMGREIWQLARTIKQHPDLAAIILESNPGQAIDLLRKQHDATKFNDQLDDFLAKHGHRTLKEFELNSARWDEDPSLIIGMVRNYLLADSDPAVSAARIKQQRQDVADKVSEGLASLPLEKLLGWRGRTIKAIQKKVKYFIKLRENSRFFHIMGFYAVRLKVLEVETALLDSGALKCKDDIFYLNWSQITDLQTGKLTWAETEGLIRSQRMNHIRLGKLRPPKTIGIKIEAKSAADAEASGHQLHGQAASSGSYRGYARVIMDPAIDSELKPGEILVAPFTDPAWTPLFLIANAAVVEVGSFLSHAGTIAREYGMPCVVDVADCTSRIKSGDLIEVDGSKGTITFVDQSKFVDEDLKPPEGTVLNQRW